MRRATRRQLRREQRDDPSCVAAHPRTLQQRSGQGQRQQGEERRLGERDELAPSARPVPRHPHVEEQQHCDAGSKDDQPGEERDDRLRRRPETKPGAAREATQLPAGDADAAVGRPGTDEDHGRDEEEQDQPSRFGHRRRRVQDVVERRRPGVVERQLLQAITLGPGRDDAVTRPFLAPGDHRAGHEVGDVLRGAGSRARGQRLTQSLRGNRRVRAQDAIQRIGFACA